MNSSFKLPYPRSRCQQTFFELMLAGYATNTKPEVIQRFEGDPGTKRNTWSGLGGWLGIDEWRTSSVGDGSNGTTSIYYGKKLVWEMQYGGSYPDRVIPFLRKMLKRNYVENIWYGGRGPSAYEDDGFFYENKVKQEDFADFRGLETIYEFYPNGGDHAIGRHFYRGGFVMKNPDN